MTRMQLACVFLIASAAVLGGLLVSRLGDLGRLESQARANIVSSKGAYTFLTAQARAGDDAMFVIDNFSSQMLIYSVDVNRKRMELAQSIDLNRLFAGGPGGGGAGR